MQRASTDTGRKRGAHSIILRELGWLQSHHEAKHSDKRQRTSPERTQSVRSAAQANEAGARAVTVGAKTTALAPGDELLAAIRDCPTHRPGSTGDETQRATSTTAAAIALVDAQREDQVQLSPEILREALGASCRVGRLTLVRAVLRLMEAAVPPYTHTKESVGCDPLLQSLGTKLAPRIPVVLPDADGVDNAD
eukprot:COSAG02_NODE_4665_length_5128_cov_2.959936_4_plen_194_part_00